MLLQTRQNPPEFFLIDSAAPDDPGTVALESLAARLDSPPQVLDLESALSGAMERSVPNGSGNGASAGLMIGVAALSAERLQQEAGRLWDWLRERPWIDLKFLALTEERRARGDFSPLLDEYIHVILPARIGPEALGDIAEGAMQSLRLRHEKLQLQSRLALSSQELRRLTDVGQALSTERDFDRLIDLILGHARELVAADGGSIYVVERGKKGQPPTHLRFKKSALQLAADEFLLPIDRNSIAGYVALTGSPLVIDDVYELSGNEDYHFNIEFDKSHNYRTKSMMVIPMTNRRGETIGVIQLINKKRGGFQQRLSLEEMDGDQVIPFTEKCVELINSMAGQAAVAIQNNLLIQDIENLFEGFVTASVTAIEQRDPTTSGHSFRVAEFTVGLAKALDRLNDGPFASIRFAHDQIRELRYASLLHDFGKVGVREKVLVKAKKLYDHELETIEWRFRAIQQMVEKHYLQKKVKWLKQNGNQGFEEYERLIDMEMQQKLAEVREMLQTIRTANEPAVVESGEFERLQDVARKRIRLPDGETLPFLRENELLSLSVRRGNLDQRMRKKPILSQRCQKPKVTSLKDVATPFLRGLKRKQARGEKYS